ncbi:Phosphatidylinositol N-acetylglucosaminyltransferase subunit H [Habropoda laboriosa]|uniref:Phosphatidylinositol N-acetylglucosaminyltransferase subunit H n=1 Tax=Habropoda laboriosa TaxID=597456 RepID=A0A0L7QMC9_9HYME|nr:Phosphatidylinositol N-acetylglucosaminyltransferase subunit H [Habropoda laboriosa]
MSSTFLKNEYSSELFFRSVNGSKLKLIDKSTKAKNVMKFVLYKNIHLNVNTTFLLLLSTFVLWKAFNVLIPFILCILALILQFTCFITSVNKDTLIVVESVGVYTKGRRILYGLSSCEFIPWDTVVDIFINEVITGQKVLYYLTIIVKESFNGKDSIKLVPLFQELIPERKCLEYMYEKLAGLMGPKEEKHQF